MGLFIFKAKILWDVFFFFKIFLGLNRLSNIVSYAKEGGSF